MRKILVVGDSPGVKESLRMIFKNDFQVRTFDFGEESFSLMKKEAVDLGIVIITHPLDAKMPFLHRLGEYLKNSPVLLMIEHQLLNAVTDIFDHGIFDHVSIPFSVYDLKEKVHRLLVRGESVSSLSEVSHRNKKIAKYERIYRSPLLEKSVTAVVAKVLDNHAPVLIEGERGSGHELIAKVIHYNGYSKEAGFFKLNCLHFVESSFINALLAIMEDVPVKSIGTLFLEELAGANPGIQMTLMGIIEEGTIAAKKKEEVFFPLRIIASTCADLLQRVNDGRFREDLFYRLNAVPISLSPLRKRREDIPKIVGHVLNDVSQRLKLDKKNLSSDALSALKDYCWPRNLSELESVITRSAILTDGAVISERDLSFDMHRNIASLQLQDEKPRKFDAPPSINNEKEETGEVWFEELITNLAHEITPPLVSIKAFAQLLPEKFEDDKFRGQFYQIVRENVDRIDGLVRRMVDYTQFHTQDLCDVNLRGVIEAALEKNLREVVGRKPVILKEFEKDLPPVWSDKSQLQYVFDNALSTAIAMAPEGKGLSLSVRVSDRNSGKMGSVGRLKQVGGREVEITIPLYHSEVTALSQPDASSIMGLELFLVRKLVNKNLGMMEVDFPVEGAGMIRIKLPVAHGEGVSQPEEITPQVKAT